MILRIANDDDAASTSFDRVALGNAFRRVVRALGMKIGTDFANDGAHVLFWKDYDGVHVFEGRQNFRAFFRRHHRPPFALQHAYGCIGVHRDNQFAAERARVMQVADMADMQQIETPVGQRDALAGAPPIRHTLLKFGARNNLPME